MADENETTSSSQPRVISNNNCVSDAVNKNNYPKSKPALLPKPQISASDLRIAKAQIIQKTQVSSSAQTKVSSVKSINYSPTQQTLPPRKEIVSPPRKAPAISPKPQLPPKSNNFKKLIKVENSTPQPSRPKPEVSPKKFNSAPPVRPPRSPKRTPKTDPFDFLSSPTSPQPPSDFREIRREKSASLARNENLNWTAKELNKNSKTPIKYYQQISNRRNSEREIFIDGKEPPTPRPRIKNKPKLNLELDLASCNSPDSIGSSPNIESSCPIYATVDYSKKKNRKIQEEERVFVSTTLQIEEGYYSTFEAFETRRSSESSESFKSLVDSENSPERQIHAISSLSAVNETEDTFVNNICDNESQNLDCNGVTHDDIISEVGTVLKIEEEELNVKEFEHRKNEDDVGSLNNNNNDNNNYSPTNNNNYKSNVINSNCGNDEQSEKREIEETTPQSFLHRLVSAGSIKTEEKENPPTPVINEVIEKGTDQRESFLHKNENRKVDKIGSFDSYEFISIEDVNMESTPKLKLNGTKSNDSNHQIIPPDTSHSLSPVVYDSAAVNNSKGSSESLTKLNSSDPESFGITKRFPWFGSFGKGHKKQTEKKERCASQFYTSPSSMGSDADLSERSRAISLPDIKNSGHEPRLMIRREENDWNSSISESINSGYSEENPNSDSDDDKDSVQRLDMNSDKTTKTDKAFLIAKELMTSEEVFIDVLRLLNVDFRNFIEYRNHESKNSIIPLGDVCKILNYLPQLQALNEDLLADMKKRIENWGTNPKIADVIVKKGAFLKMYTSYIQSFEQQTNYLDECTAKYPKFAKEVKEFEATDRCKKLSIKHYMLKPVQRIPQYRLLLNDYLKHLDENSVDYSDTLRALKIVCDVAEHANRSMKDGDKNGRLMHYQSLLGDFELIKPGREFIKDGSLEKICRKTVKDRFFILLNDCLLHTTYSKTYLKIHQVLSLHGMKVSCNEEKKYPHSFTVVSRTKSFILCAKTEAERGDWVEALQKAIEDYISRQKTFMNVKLPETDSFKLGKEAPVWIQDQKVTMCQICMTEFTTLFRRHHCRACGRVVCGKCVGNQAPLQYRKFKPEKVCDSCFNILLKDYEDSEDSIYEYLKEVMRSENEEVHNAYLDIKSKFIKSSSTNSYKKQKFIPPRLKEVSANDTEATMSGWLFRKWRSGRSWKQHWYVLKEHVLYIYRASEDVMALETIPVLGYDVMHAEENVEEVDKKLIFSLTHPQQSPLVFHADTEELAERWFAALSTATKFDELPS